MKIFIVFILGCILGLTMSQEKIQKLTTTPVATLPDGAHYYGELSDGTMQGQGEMLWPNGTSYIGQFENGLFHGTGTIKFIGDESYSGEFTQGEITGFGRYTYSKTSHYSGELLNGRMHGTGVFVEDENEYVGQFQFGLFQGHGVYTYADGEKFRGDFVDGQFTGQGHHKFEGGEYLGGFDNWVYHGEGTYSDDAGNQWIGIFEQGSMIGQGEVLVADGSFYRGDIESWRYQGKGIYRAENGDVYEGSFASGHYHGEGLLTFNKPVDGIKTVKGKWQRGKLVSDEARPDFLTEKSFHELVLYNQNDLLAQSWQQLEKADPAKIDLYLLTIAGDGNQGVFRREANSIKEYFDTELGTAGKSMQLVNSRLTAKTIPLSTSTSIDQSLHKMAERMDEEQDILFVYLTSHGSKEHKFYLNNSAMPLNDLPATELASMLDDIPVKWKVIVVSACYSGGFIPELKSDTTLVITAAAADRTSFGCSDNVDFTYFGEAFIKDSLASSKTFVEAFDKAIKIVAAREKEEGFEPSNPKIHSPKAILTQLKHWRSGLSINNDTASQ
jgi:hypothetical protein